MLLSSPSSAVSSLPEATLPPIPMVDLARQYAERQEEMDAAALGVLRSGRYILGEEGRALEAEISQFLSDASSHALAKPLLSLGVANGSDSLYLALRALNLQVGDEVITTSMSYIATSESIVRAGGTPVFVDIDPDTFNIDLSLIEAAITPKTKGFLPVHLFGQAVEMDTLMSLAQRHGLWVLEDCAQAIGATWQGQAVGTFGALGSFSFFPTKNLGAAGDGGLVTTADDELAEKVKMLRVHGAKTRYDHVTEGINSRLDEVQAALLRIKLRALKQFNEGRRAVAQSYNEGFAEVAALQTPKVSPHAYHVYHQYTLKVPPQLRETLQQGLAAQGIASMIYYPIPLHLQGMHQNLNYKVGAFPQTERVANEVLSLPIFPEMTAQEVERVIKAVKALL
jgi:dTDP-4-amino-4,6-dideoxygalactose transaminase